MDSFGRHIPRAIALLLLCACALLMTNRGAGAQQPAKPTPTPSPTPALPLAPLKREFRDSFPIPVGERIEYEIRFSRFPIYATVGVVAFDFLGIVPANKAAKLIPGQNVEFTPAENEEYFHLRAEAISKGILIAILGVDVRDRFESLIDTRDFTARLGFKEIKEGKKHISQTAVFDRGGQTVNLKINDLNKPDAPPREIRMERKDGMLDLLSAFYFARLQKLKEGQLLRFPVSDDDGSYQFDVVVGKTEKLKTECGKVKAIRLEPKLFGPGQIFSRKGEMTMWVSADNKHVPLRLIAKTDNGTVSAKLTNFKKNCRIIEPDPDQPADPPKK
ncbi:MAG: DUF3108 domain-containing protein [Blastocatellia bacterium]|nr:DUF3108 domain-containing protein [Blastocatellia bacterium]